MPQLGNECIKDIAHLEKIMLFRTLDDIFSGMRINCSGWELTDNQINNLLNIYRQSQKYKGISFEFNNARGLELVSKFIIESDDSLESICITYRGSISDIKDSPDMVCISESIRESMQLKRITVNVKKLDTIDSGVKILEAIRDNQNIQKISFGDETITTSDWINNIIVGMLGSSKVQLAFTEITLHSLLSLLPSEPQLTDLTNLEVLEIDGEMTRQAVIKYINDNVVKLNIWDQLSTIYTVNLLSTTRIWKDLLIPGEYKYAESLVLKELYTHILPEEVIGIINTLLGNFVLDDLSYPFVETLGQEVIQGESELP